MMKKSFIVLGIVLAGFSSCRKDRTCTCTDSNGTTLGTASYVNVKKSEAKTFCNANQTQYQTTDPGASCVVR